MRQHLTKPALQCLTITVRAELPVQHNGALHIPPDQVPLLPGGEQARAGSARLRLDERAAMLFGQRDGAVQRFRGLHDFSQHQSRGSRHPERVGPADGG